MSLIPSFEELHTRLNRVTSPDQIILAIDPGETTGIRIFKGLVPDTYHQIKGATPAEAAAQIEPLIDSSTPHLVVMEEYRVYAHRTRQHAGSDLFTPRLIGALEMLVSKRQLPLIKQTATQAKKFFTDDKLRQWGFYLPGKKHANDATRHGCYHILFGKPTVK